MLTPMHWLLILLVGGVLMVAIFVLIVGLMPVMAPPESPMKDRLRGLKSDGSGPAKSDDPFEGKLQEWKETLLTLVAPLAQNLYGKNVSYQKSIKTLLTEAGLPDNEEAISRFLSMRVVLGVISGAICFFIALLLAQPMLYTVGALIFGLLGGANIVQIRLRGMASQRRAEIRYSLSDTLDLMVICMEAGLGLDATIQRVADESERMAPELSQELRRVTKELNVGIPRMDAFHNLGSRSGVEELRALCALIIQTDKLGTSIADTLRVYADDMRTKRRQRAEELAAQASIKMTFPLVLFIFPPMFIVLIGPAAIQAMSLFSAGK